MQLDGSTARLIEVCGAEDAADLADWLRDGGTAVDVSEATHFHASLLQCFMVFRPTVEGLAENPAVSAVFAATVGWQEAARTGDPA